MKLAAFTKTYGQRRVLDFPGYDFEPGRIYAIIGANGSGKSTFARIVAGIEKADADTSRRDGGETAKNAARCDDGETGRRKVAGDGGCRDGAAGDSEENMARCDEVVRRKIADGDVDIDVGRRKVADDGGAAATGQRDNVGRRKIADLKIGFMPQHSYAFRMSTLSNVMLNGASEEEARQALDNIGLTELADKPAHKLSGGETARMALARLLVGNYDAILLDEPCASMDIKSVALAEQMIKDYIAAKGAAVIIVTHSLQQAKRLADEVLFFHEGRLAASGPAATLLTINKEENEELQEFLQFY